MARRKDLFTTVRTEGALLPPDLLERLSKGDKDLEGLTPSAYHLPGTEKLPEAINRSWNRLVGAFEAYQAALEALPESDPATTQTREKWLLPLFSELGYGRLSTTKAIEAGGKDYPISHLWQSLPIHLVGAWTPLDRRSEGVKGAARTSPHSLLQELLNRSEEHTWGIVSNGERLRLLRDNVSLTRQAYVEFDLGAMMRGEVYSDFALLWLLCHQSRFEAERPAEFLIERWKEAAHKAGTRALDRLRDGVSEAITALGQGFLSHPQNAALREALKEGTLSTQDYYRQLLRLCYRLIFLFVAEDRDLLFDPQAPEEAKARYRSYFSTQRLRDIASRRRGTRHADLYRVLRLVASKLGSDEGSPELGLPALGSFLWRSEALPDLQDAELPNTHLLSAVRALAFTREEKVLLPIDYRNIGSEELGSIYESLLELHPEINTDAATFSLEQATGSERKTTGSYYTPTSLISALLDSVLDPVLEEAARKEDYEEAILNLKVLDPACGSGHFLVAAAHRIARRLAARRIGEEEPTPETTRTALRDVIGRCVYGVDLNPMAVELCKVSLWMEAVEPGKPLSFLEHKIVQGNSLLGATPALIAKGIPDEAFKALEGDDKKVVSALKKRNKEERKGQEVLFGDAPSVAELTKPLAEAVLALDEAPGATSEDIKAMEKNWEALQASDEAARAKLIADAWCAAFVIEKTEGSPALTDGVLRLLASDPEGGDPRLKEEIQRLAGEYSFLHPHLAFPGVFGVPEDLEAAENPEQGWNGGFDVVIGNPPWERVKLQEKEWFATRHEGIANAPNAAARKKLIADLRDEDPELYAEWLAALRVADGVSEFVRSSDRYPLCGRGDVNTYSIFAELMRSLLQARGLMGAIVPTGIATDHTTRLFFAALVQSNSLVSLFDFENAVGMFEGVGHGRFKFCLLTLAGAGRAVPESEFAFFAHYVSDLADEGRRFELSAEDFALLNPNTRTCPVFRNRRDAEIVKGIYRRVPVLIDESKGDEGNPWGITFQAMFHMANDSHKFRTRDELEAEGWVLDGNIFRRAEDEYLPLYEAKMMWHFTHRWGDYSMRPERSQDSQLPDVPEALLGDPLYGPLPRYWVERDTVEQRLDGVWSHDWLLGWRDVTNATNERTVVASIIPRYGAGHKLPLMFPTEDPSWILANLNSLVLDFVARQKFGGTSLTYFVMKQLPILPPAAYPAGTPWLASTPLRDWITTRVVELVATAHDLQACSGLAGLGGRILRWDSSRRETLRAELDAAYLHLYDIDRDTAAYILDTFPIVRRNEERLHGEFRTKRLVLERFDAINEALTTGATYQTPLELPPADQRLAADPPFPVSGRGLKRETL